MPATGLWMAKAGQLKIFQTFILTGELPVSLRSSNHKFECGIIQFGRAALWQKQ